MSYWTNTFLNQCSDQEFGCYDGTCVSLESHCDEVDDCDDGSDELDCKLIMLDAQRYRQEYPPISNTKEPLMVNIGNHFFGLIKGILLCEKESNGKHLLTSLAQNYERGKV